LGQIHFIIAENNRLFASTVSAVTVVIALWVMLAVQAVSQLQFSSIVFELPSQKHKFFLLTPNVIAFSLEFLSDYSFFLYDFTIPRLLLSHQA